MIFTALSDIIGSERDLQNEGWSSRRLLLASDGMGFSLTDTLIEEDTVLTMEYRHHLQACYCIEGQGELTAHPGGEKFLLEPFAMYALDKHDRHSVRAIGGDLRLICVFNPPLFGKEVHRADGSYSAPAG